jgi:D-xylose reductase
MRAIAGLDRHRRYNDPGVFCELAFGTFFPIYD